MKNLIGNPFEVFLKDADRSITGILIETDEQFDYIQDEGGVCIVPKSNVLYYRTNELSKYSKVIKSAEVPLIAPPQERQISVMVDKVRVAWVAIPSGEVNANELLEFIYAQEPVQKSLAGRKQKSVECFDDVVYITTDQQAQVAFTMDSGNPMTSYVSPIEMVTRLNNVRKPQ